jgi:ribosomal 50S subunit-recycling heat shock protein
MRLDLFLKVSRLVPRRSVAQEFCDRGLVEVNGSAAKSSKEVQAGDEITIRRRNRLTKVEITEIPASKQIAKSSAAELYRVISDEALADDLLS